MNDPGKIKLSKVSNWHKSLLKFDAFSIFHNYNDVKYNHSVRRVNRLANKMGNKLVALCTVALGAIYGTGYVVTKIPTVHALAAQPEHTNASASPVATGTANGSTTSSHANLSNGTGVAKHVASPTARNTTSHTKKPVASVPKAPAKPAVNTTSQYLDGTYHGSGSDNIGTVYVAVTIHSGKISNVQITQCDTHYPQAYIDPVLPQEVVARQNASVDMVSGATDSSSDFAVAVQQALAQAKNPHYAG